MATVFKRTFDFFQTVWSTTIKPFIGWAWNQVQRLHNWLVKTFAPVLRHLKTLRAWILDHYEKWLRPIFDTIDAVRQTLRVLETFHVPFARKIDQALADLEARLLAPIRFALTKLNELTNWIDRIVDFNGLFQRLTLIESAWHYTGDLWSALLKHQPAGVSHEDNDRRRAQTVTPIDARTLAAQAGDYYAAGAGPLAAQADALVHLWLTSTVQ